MKGDISVVSEENVGSNFILVFPANSCKENAAFAFKTESMDDPKTLQGKNCILIENIHENSYIIKELLQNHGLEVNLCMSGQEALRAYESGEKTDVIITGLIGPGITGQNFIQEIRAFEKRGCPHKFPIPIIILTAESSSEEQKKYLTKHGASEYLVKPIKNQELIAALIRVCSNNQRKKLEKNKKRNILIIEDDVLSSKYLSTVITREGHIARQCHNIKDVIKYLC